MLLFQNRLYLLVKGEKIVETKGISGFQVVPFSPEFRTARLKVTAYGKVPCTSSGF
jgi:hypothetical protein